GAGDRPGARLMWEPFWLRLRRTDMKLRVIAPLVALVLSSCAGLDAEPADTTTEGSEGPVYVETTDILQMESFPVQVRLVVGGSLPTPCHEARWEVDDDGSQIGVRLWSTVMPGQDCAQVLEPVELSIALGSFESGERIVLLNDEEIGRFTIGGATPTVALTAAGWSFGMCLGYCNADLTVDGGDVVLSGRDRENAEPLFVNRGALTMSALEQIGVSAEELSGVPLDPVYGCPDCADGGAAYVVLTADGVTSRYDMEFGRPPEVLADLHQLAMAVMEAVETCGSNELVTVADDCVPWEGR
ncbi:MAG: hypothetical protein ACXW15_02705, partial [Acidimicrobiia bacterium]